MCVHAICTPACIILFNVSVYLLYIYIIHAAFDLFLVNCVIETNCLVETNLSQIK